MNRRLKNVETLRESYNLKDGEKGITLIALIVTIIVLLILAMVSVNLILRDNLILKAQSAKEEYESSAQKEAIALNEFETEVNKYIPTGSGDNESDEVVWGYEEDGDMYYMGNASEFKFTSDEVQAKLVIATTNEKGYPSYVEFAEDAEVVIKKISESDSLYMTNFNKGTGPSIIDFNGTTVINPENYDDPRGIQRLKLGDTVITVKGLEGWAVIPYYSFSYAKNLKNITIPDSVRTISSNAFYGCTNLNNIIIPNSVETIGSYDTFYSCTNLKTIKVNRTLSDAEATLGTSWIPSGATVTYNDQVKTY